MEPAEAEAETRAAQPRRSEEKEGRRGVWGRRDAALCKLVPAALRLTVGDGWDAVLDGVP